MDSHMKPPFVNFNNVNANTSSQICYLTHAIKTIGKIYMDQATVTVSTPMG
jgi:hypothetical protein